MKQRNVLSQQHFYFLINQGWTRDRIEAYYPWLKENPSIYESMEAECQPGLMTSVR